MDSGRLLWQEDLSAELREKAEKELFETSDKRHASMKILKALIEGEPDFKPCTDEVFLLRFLRYKKFDLKRAWSSLKNYYACRARYSGWLTDLTPEDIEWLMPLDKLLVSPVRDRNGCAVVIISIGTLDLGKASLEQYIAILWVVAEALLSLESIQVSGAFLLFDHGDMSLTQLGRIIRPYGIYMLIHMFIDTFPFRIKGIHGIFERKDYRFTYNTFLRPLLSKKMRERVILHGEDFESLHKYVPPECLPEKYGGSLRGDFVGDFRNEVFKSQTFQEKLRQYVHKGKMYPKPLQECWTES